MHRRNLLDKLAEYQTRYPQEQNTIDRFQSLLGEHANCFERDCWVGHITGSSWLVDPSSQRLLLTHHRKLDMWLQLGGHSDGDPDSQAVAMREAREESGLGVALLSPQLFDIDIHEIPARKSDPAHFHFDVRYCLQADGDEFLVSEESLALAWVGIGELERYTTETSILRMRDKWLSSGLASLGL